MDASNRSASPLVIWADDLSGAANALAPFGDRGLGTAIITGLDGMEEGREPCVDIDVPRLDALCFDAVCFDVDAREGGAESIPAIPAPSVLKIDSLGRGRIVELVAEVCGRFAYDTVLLAPAWPSQGRAVIGGRGERGVEWNAIGVAVSERIAAAGHPVPTVVVADAGAQEDLERLLPDTDESTLLVGSQGIAAAIASRWSGRPRTRLVDGAAAGGLREGGTLAVIGSVDPVALNQLEHLRTSGWPELVLRVDDPHPDASKYASALSAGEGVVCSLGADTAEEWSYAIERHSETFFRLMCAASRIVATGGATGGALLRLLGVKMLRDVRETPRGISEATLPDGRTFATQPGSVGSTADLLEFHTSHTHASSKETSE